MTRNISELAIYLWGFPRGFHEEIPERSDSTKNTIFELIGVESGSKLVALISTSAGNDVQKSSLRKIKSLSPPWISEISILFFVFNYRTDNILSCSLKEFAIWLHIAWNLEKTLILA